MRRIILQALLVFWGSTPIWSAATYCERASISVNTCIETSLI